MYARYRIPGIRFDAVAPAPAEGLPRMDVGVFVGFAASGPTHRPVLIEDVASFAAVFGGALPLAYDTEEGAVATAALAPAVRAFFSNGGRRCWVIRVAWTAALRDAWASPANARPVATARRFALPGLLALVPNTPERRSAFGLVETAFAEARSVGSWADDARACTRAERLAFPLVDAVRKPELIRFAAPQQLGAGELIEFATPAGAIAYARTVSVAGGVATATPLAIYHRLTEDEPSAPGTAAILDGANRAAGFAVAGGVARVAYAAGQRAEAAIGGWLHWRDADRSILIAIDGVENDAIVGRAWLRRPPSIPSGPLVAARLRLGLRVETGRGAAHEASFGLDPAGEAAWRRNLPDDLHYADAQASAAARPPLSVDTASAGPLAWLPLGLDDAWSAPADPVPVTRTALERDGLSQYDERLFLDPALAGLSVATLADEATRIRDVDGRALFGIHGAFHVSGTGRDTDATLIAVPDAVHPGWARRAAEPLPEQPEPNGTPPATWTAHRGPCSAPSTIRPEEPLSPSTARQGRRSGQAAEAASRRTGESQALRDGLSPSLNHPSGRTGGPDWSRFLDCDTRVLPTPVLAPFTAPQPTGTLTLRWTASTSDAVYTLEEATEADLSDAEPIWTGTELSTVVSVPREGVYRYRITAADGEDVSAPSAIAVAVADRAWTVASTFAAPQEALLTTLHRATLRTAAASGELFAMLSLPRRFRTPAATRHAERLQSLAAADPAERRALSFGALYHPWLVTPSGDVDAPALTALPPDGAAAGIAAARALARGAWIAPANVPIHDIVALAGPIADTDRQPVGEAGINLVRRDARGFLVLDAQTLSPEADWRQVGVRRLMSLLRRTALDRGRRYVFEPNSDVLRRAVERGFTLMLDDLFRRGAFAGKGREDSWRLVVDPTSQDRDAGRLLVEIAVAPAQPMRFLTVRLVQSGERFSVAEER